MRREEEEEKTNKMSDVVTAEGTHGGKKLRYIPFSGEKGEDFEDWFDRTKVIMKANGGIHLALENDYSSLIATEMVGGNLTEEQKKSIEHNNKAVEQLRLALKGTRMTRCFKNGNGIAYKIIEQMKHRVVPKGLGAVKKITDKMENLKLKDHVKEDPADLMDKLQELNDKLEDIENGTPKTKKELITMFLNKLSKAPEEAYLTFVESKLDDEKETMKMELWELSSKAHNFWMRNYEEEDSDSDDSETDKKKVKAFNVRPGGGKFTGTCHVCKKVGHKADACWLNPKSPNFKKDMYDKWKKNNGGNANGDRKGYKDGKIVCYNCGEVGHPSFKCPKKNNKTVDGLFAGMTYCIPLTSKRDDKPVCASVWEAKEEEKRIELEAKKSEMQLRWKMKERYVKFYDSDDESSVDSDSSDVPELVLNCGYESDSSEELSGETAMAGDTIEEFCKLDGKDGKHVELNPVVGTMKEEELTVANEGFQLEIDWTKVKPLKLTMKDKEKEETVVACAVKWDDEASIGSEDYAGDTGAAEHFVKSDHGMWNHRKPKKKTAMGVGGKTSAIESCGDVGLKDSESGALFCLTGANHSPEFQKNLISIGRMTDDGWEVQKMNNEVMTLVRGDQTIRFKRRKDGLYYVRCKPNPDGLDAMSAQVNQPEDEQLESWKTVTVEVDGNGEPIQQRQKKKKPAVMDHNFAHDTMGHPGNNLLEASMKVHGLKLEGSHSKCEGCAKAKAKQRSVSKTTNVKAEKPGERLYVDTSGPFSKTWDGKRYMRMAVDDFSRVGIVDLSWKKDKMDEWFEKDIVIPFKNNGHTVKYLRADGAGENVGPLRRVCANHGIALELTAPDTPQQNGVVERRIAVIQQKALAAMCAANLNQETQDLLWGEAVMYANKTVNIMPNTRKPHSYPMREFTGQETQLVPYLQPFGRIGVVTIRKKLHGKWKEKGIKMIMVGYSGNRSADSYRMFNPKTCKVIDSRDVTWLDWRRADPKRDMSIFVKEPTTLEEPSGIDDKEVVIDLSNDDSPSEAGRKIEDGAPKSEDAPKSESTNEIPVSEASRKAQADAERRAKRLQRELQKLDTSYNPTTGGGTRISVETKDGHEREVFLVFNTELSSDPGEPKTFDEAFDHPNAVERERWRRSIGSEIENFLSRNSWSLYPRADAKADGRKTVGVKVVFKKKDEVEGSQAPNTYGNVRYKSRGVTLGYQQIPGVDYTESHSPVATDTAIRLLFAIALYFGWDIELIDVEAAFLEGKLSTPMMIEWMPGMVELGYITQEEADNYVCLLTGGMYGNVQAALEYYREFKKCVKEAGMQQSLTDPCVFYKRDKDGDLMLMVAMHVDDNLITGTNEAVRWFKEIVGRRFKYRDEGKLKKYKGAYFEWQTDNNNERCLVMSMPKLVREIIEAREKMTGKEAKIYETPGTPNVRLKKNEGEAVNATEYRSMVGKIMYLVTQFFAEGSNAARDMARHFTNPGEEHWSAVDRFVGFLKGNEDDIKLTFRKPRELRTAVACDSDYSTDTVDRRSVSGKLLTVGGTVTNWGSYTQKTASGSSTESEYYSASEGVKHLLFQNQLMGEMTECVKPSILGEDNSGARFLMKNGVTSSNTKHLEIRAHHMRQHYDMKEFDVIKVDTEDMDADIFSKNLAGTSYKKHSQNLRNGTTYLYENWDEIVSQITNDFTEAEREAGIADAEVEMNNLVDQARACGDFRENG